MRSGRLRALLLGAVIGFAPALVAAQPAHAQQASCGSVGPATTTTTVGTQLNYPVNTNANQQFNISIQWGDGGVSNANLTTGQSTTLSHTYTQAGTYNTLVTVNGALADGTACSNSVPGTITVTGPPAQPPPAQPPAPAPDPAPAPAPAPEPAPAPAPAQQPMSLLDPANPLNPNNTLRASQAFVFPSTKRCVSKRNFRIRLVRPKLVTYVAAKVAVNGKQVPVIIRRTRYTNIRGKVLKLRQFTARVDLRGLTKGRFTTSITAYTQTLLEVKGVRRYKTCTGKERGGKPRV